MGGIVKNEMLVKYIQEGSEFFSYAEPWIKKSIYRYNDNGGNNIRVPEYMKGRIRRYMTARSDFIMKNDRKPTNKELMEIMGIPPVGFNFILETY